MGRRSRKRITEPLAAPTRERDDDLLPPAPSGPPAPPPPRTPTYVANRDDAPPPPWGSFPLTELGIFLALVLLAIAFFVDGNRALFAGAGVVILTLSAGELAVREHLAGYRSHTTLIAGATAVFGAYVLRLAFIPVELVPPLAVVIFAGMFYMLRREFTRRSGGVGFRT